MLSRDAPEGLARRERPYAATSGSIESSDVAIRSVGWIAVVAPTEAGTESIDASSSRGTSAKLSLIGLSRCATCGATSDNGNAI